jgi:hypothetical protein
LAFKVKMQARWPCLTATCHAGYGAAALLFAPEIGYHDPRDGGLRLSPGIAARDAKKNLKNKVKNNVKR